MKSVSWLIGGGVGGGGLVALVQNAAQWREFCEVGGEPQRFRNSRELLEW